MARDVGYISYEGLPGTIHTGCINSPAYNSRFCEDHGAFVCNLQIASDQEITDAILSDDFSPGPITRARAKATGAEIPEKVCIVESILDSRVTRSNTYYKVMVLMFYNHANSATEASKIKSEKHTWQV